MTTIADVLNDLGIGDIDTEKTASQNQEINQLEKLAMDLGVVEKNNESTITNEEPVLNKEAGVNNDLGAVFAEMFPESAEVVEKIASAELEVTEMEKEAAAIEEAKGAYAHDVFAGLLDERITKIAADIVGKIEDNEDESGKTPGTKEDTSEAEKILSLNPEGAVGTFKAASENPAMAKLAEAYELGMAVGEEIANSIDEMYKAASEKEEEEEKKELNEEQKKEASYLAGGINEGALAKLASLGTERHGNPFHYIADAVVEKIAAAVEVETVEDYNVIAEKVAMKMNDLVNKVKGQAKSIAQHGKQAVTGVGRKGVPLTAKERLLSGAKALGKASIPVAVVGGAGYGTKKLLEKKDK